MPSLVPDRLAEHDSDPIVACEGVAKRYGDRLAVDHIDLAVPAGLCFGLLGPNGAGKTTMLRMIYGATPPSAGIVRVFGLDVTQHTRRVRMRLGVTLQENALVEVLSAVENLRIFARYHRLPRVTSERRIEELLDFLELRSHATLPVRALSGGFQRRVAIAVSLIHRPELLILDEPTTGLDPAVRLALWERIRELRSAGTTVLLTTHYMDEAQRLCDRLAILSAGRVVADGSPAALIRQHLAAQALELTLPAGEDARVLAEIRDVRTLRMGRRLVLFADDATALLETLRERGRTGDPSAVVVRPANLEDVFLALTGTALEGDA
ncbi:ABC transporter ATP-binding protein [Myxococcota bacterium]|nr:ABC transporter ATP-binding protein [Myxococcota bacterium]MCZ7620414.1 ABC transporter ATP-binding protein [Myxococcota bacterium]